MGFVGSNKGSKFPPLQPLFSTSLLELMMQMQENTSHLPESYPIDEADPDLMVKVAGKKIIFPSGKQ